MRYTTAPLASTAAAVPRGWRSLLTGRWHQSSWVVAALVLLLLVFCNVPGQVSEFEFDGSTATFEHDGVCLVLNQAYSLAS